MTLIINYRASVAMSEARRTIRIERAITARGAALYAGFLLPHLRPDMVVLDCGCGQATISIGLAGTVAAGRVIGVDRGEESLAVARRNAASIKQVNLGGGLADGRSLPFLDAAVQ